MEGKKIKIVLFGFRYHPYTLDILESLHKKKIKPCALIEAKPKYTIDQMSNSPDIDVQFLTKIDLKNIISFWALKHIFYNPYASLKILKSIFSARNANTNIKEKSELKDLLKNINILKVDDHTGKKCENILKRLEPDIIVLCPASSIIRSNVLTIPKIGVLNAHMGLLPKFRGMNALEWTLYHLGKGYVSIYFVDEGIDTGEIIKIFEVPLKNNFSIDYLRIVARKKMASGLVETIKLIESNSIIKKNQEIGEGKQYFSMHENLKKITEIQLKKRVKMKKM